MIISSNGVYQAKVVKGPMKITVGERGVLEKSLALRMLF